MSTGDSSRIGVDETETTALVTTGLFARVRNPIFSFMRITLFGLTLVVPNPLYLIAGALTTLAIEVHLRAVEEPHLASTHETEYDEYASRVGRFLPGVGCRKRVRRAPSHR